MKDYYNNSLTSWVPDDARTAVVNYGEYGEVVLPMGTFAETVGNFNQLQNSNRIGGRTNTKEALDLAKSLFDMTDFREHAVVLITDKQPENSICQDWPESITTAVITTFGNASSQLDCIVSESSDNGDSFTIKLYQIFLIYPLSHLTRIIKILTWAFVNLIFRLVAYSQILTK
eukprot:UN31352